jgi:hypothetical protein
LLLDDLAAGLSCALRDRPGLAPPARASMLTVRKTCATNDVEFTNVEDQTVVFTDPT